MSQTIFASPMPPTRPTSGLQHLHARGQGVRELEAGGQPLAVGDRHRGALGDGGDVAEIV
jgi:hypothetical protein